MRTTESMPGPSAVPSGNALDSGSRATRHRRPRHRGPVRRLLRWIGIALAILLIPAGISYTRTLMAPGSTNWKVRSVEWISDHGGGRLVLFVEHVWYSHHAPPVGGAPENGLPEVAVAPSVRRISPDAPTVPHLPKPPNIVPFAKHPLPREGKWRPAGPAVNGMPSMYAAFLRPDPVHTSLVSGVVWMDPNLVKAVLVPGVQEPGGQGWKWFGEVPKAARTNLAAAFNSGFRMKGAQGGFYSEGRTAVPLKTGAASLVIYKDGTATVGAWGTEVRMSSNVQSVRQNLHLMIDNGRLSPSVNTDSSSLWGATLGSKIFVWRSGVGVTADGALVYVASNGLNVATLAGLLKAAGCVRAMEMDINPEWTTFNFYTQDHRSPYAVDGHKLLPDMQRSSDRYLVVDERDFVAMFLRKLG
jgi:uncharacterized protein YigE (DUF2233 family)